ncbi:MAG: flagellar export protein FliJ [Clostridiales bacterium GWB2_37_7]|nr:MAG: flagellar export protein FliJ [Clostridiales bacterium GWB2_37_7]
MAGYKFKLQNILKLKESMEKDKKNEFGAAIQRLENEKLKLENLNAEMINMCNEVERAAAEGISIQELVKQQQYKEYYKHSISNQKVRTNMAEEHLENCRQELVEAVQDRKIMERLKEIDYCKHLYTEQKNEEKLVDDLVSFKQSNK